MSGLEDIPVEEVHVRERHRQDLGDVDSLIASIERVGLLHPIVVRSDRTLIAGGRRLAAIRKMGYPTILAHVVDNLHDARELLFAERDENIERKDMTPSEKVALGRALEDLERPKAAERQRATLRRGDQVPDRETFPDGDSRDDRTGKVYDLVGEAVGMSGPTYKRAKAVVAAAEEGIAEAVEARDEMDQTGKVAPAYQKATANVDPQQQRARRRESFNASPGRNADVARVNKQRVWTVVSTLDGVSTGLDSIHLAAALAVTNAEEVDEMARLLSKSIADLRRFRQSLLDGRNNA